MCKSTVVTIKQWNKHRLLSFCLEGLACNLFITKNIFQITIKIKKSKAIVLD